MSTLYEERLERTMAAVRGETPDRVPISFLGTACVARWQGESIGRYCTDMDFNWRVNLKGMEMIGEPDSTHAAIYSPYTLPGSGGEIDTLNEEAALDEPPSDFQAETTEPAEETKPELPAETPAPEEKPAEEKKSRFSWF